MSQQNRIVEQSFDRCAVASLCTIQLREKVGRFVGSIMNHHGIKKGGLEQLAQPLKQVQVDDQSTHPSIHQSFVASGRCIEPDAPALWSSGGGNSGIEPFGTGGDTHTHGHIHLPAPRFFLFRFLSFFLAFLRAF